MRIAIGTRKGLWTAGALGPKKAFPRGKSVAECLIPVDSWTGEGRKRWGLAR